MDMFGSDLARERAEAMRSLDQHGSGSTDR
jgi:hypothetical protein